MDINMPDIDGIVATETIRKAMPFVQIVILSVQGDPNYMRRAMMAGARDFLTKPPSVDELTSAIRRAGRMAQEERAKTPNVCPVRRVKCNSFGCLRCQLWQDHHGLQPKGRHRLHHAGCQPGYDPSQ